MIRIGHNCINTTKIEFVRFVENKTIDIPSVSSACRIEVYLNNNVVYIDHERDVRYELYDVYLNITYAIEGIYPELKIDCPREYGPINFHYKRKPR